MGQTLYHTALLAPSLQGADPWSNSYQIVITYAYGYWTWDQLLCRMALAEPAIV